MIKRIALALAVLFALSGCGGEHETGVSYEVIHVVVDGRTIPCVISDTGGMSCDWSRSSES